MKKLSKLLALLLALALVFSLVACGADKDDDDEKDDKGSSAVEDEKDDKNDKDNKEEEEEEEEPTDEELLIGEWTYSFDMSALMNEQMYAMLGLEISSDAAIDVSLTYEFKNNGKFIMTIAVDEDSFSDYLDDLIDQLIDYMYEMAEEQGMSKEDFDATVEEEYGMSVKEYVDAMMAESLEGALDEMSNTTSGYYMVDADEGVIYVAEDEDDLDEDSDYMEYSVTETKLTVKDMVGSDFDVSELEDLGMELPWKFTKQ